VPRHGDRKSAQLIVHSFSSRLQPPVHSAGHVSSPAGVGPTSHSHGPVVVPVDSVAPVDELELESNAVELPVGVSVVLELADPAVASVVLELLDSELLDSDPLDTAVLDSDDEPAAVLEELAVAVASEVSSPARVSPVELVGWVSPSADSEVAAVEPELDALVLASAPGPAGSSVQPPNAAMATMRQAARIGRGYLPAPRQRAKDR
jgi:hypothetical protein